MTASVSNETTVGVGVKREEEGARCEGGGQDVYNTMEHQGTSHVEAASDDARAMPSFAHTRYHFRMV